jgi:hypothetical protein
MATDFREITIAKSSLIDLAGMERRGQGFAMSGTEPKPSVLGPWIWVLVVILICLLLVPFASVGLAVYKPYAAAIAKRVSSATGGQQAPGEVAEEPQDSHSGEFARFKATVERTANRVFHLGRLNPKINQIQIEPSKQAPIKDASDGVHQVLDANHQQYVQAVEKDKIRIIVILPSKDWAALAKQLKDAAGRDGYLYRGPSQTSTIQDQNESMIAEIEIRKRPSAPSSPNSAATSTAQTATPTKGTNIH